ncbi:MAG: hypothetical protein QUV06_13405 [Cyanobium sp. CZS 48M]|nr:hypothetical protein [Cyanobium sp. CZS48M]
MVSAASPNFLAMAALESLDQSELMPSSNQIMYDTCLLYYNSMTLISAADFFGLPHPVNPELLDSEPFCEAWPWQSVSVDAAGAIYRQGIDLEYAHHAPRHVPIEYPWYYGPVSEDKINLETSRLTKTIASILSKGYVFNDTIDGDITGWLLVDGPDWCVHVHSGLHRLAALTGLLFPVLPIRIEQVLYSDEIMTWPNVESGLFTRTEAGNIFRSCFTSHMACSAQSWYQKKLPNRYHELGIL